MSWLGAKTYDWLMRAPEAATLGRWRAELLAHARGAVLEIGAGTGANLDHYPAGLDRLVLSEPDRHMRAALEAKLAGRADVEVAAFSAEAIEAADASFDAVVATLVLCSVPSLDATLEQIRRVLRPDGRLIFLEHVADDEGTARHRWQRRAEPVWRALMDNCHLTRRTAEAIEAAGFTMDWIERGSITEDFVLVQPAVRGVARPRLRA